MNDPSALISMLRQQRDVLRDGLDSLGRARRLAARDKLADVERRLRAAEAPAGEPATPPAAGEA